MNISNMLIITRVKFQRVLIFQIHPFKMMIRVTKNKYLIQIKNQKNQNWKIRNKVIQIQTRFYQIMNKV